MDPRDLSFLLNTKQADDPFLIIEIPIDFGKGSNLEKRCYHY